MSRETGSWTSSLSCRPLETSIATLVAVSVGPRASPRGPGACVRELGGPAPHHPRHHPSRSRAAQQETGTNVPRCCHACQSLLPTSRPPPRRGWRCSGLGAQARAPQGGGRAHSRDLSGLSPTPFPVCCFQSESEEKVVTYDHIGPHVCMGDHKVP